MEQLLPTPLPLYHGHHNSTLCLYECTYSEYFRIAFLCVFSPKTYLEKKKAKVKTISELKIHWPMQNNQAHYMLYTKLSNI